LPSTASAGSGSSPTQRGPPDLLGALAVIAAAAPIVRAQVGGAAVESAVRERAGRLGLALSAGAVLPLQGAVNAELRTEIDAPITVAAYSFLTATAASAAGAPESSGTTRGCGSSRSAGFPGGDGSLGPAAPPT
jgi:hypothetical protein